MGQPGVGEGQERFVDDLTPTAAGAAANYPGVTALPKQKAPLSAGGTRLGWVWTDGVAAAGWEPAEQTPEAVRAGARVWSVHAAAAREGEPVSVVLEPDRYSPDYTLGAPT